MTTTLIDPPADTRRMWNRIAGFAVIAYVVLFLGLALGILPAPRCSPTELMSFVPGSATTKVLWRSGSGSRHWSSGSSSLVFVVGLLRRLAEDDTSGGILARLSFAGVVAGFGAGIVGMSLFGVMTLEPVRNASDDVLVTLSALDSVVFFVLMPWTTAVFVIFASALMLQTRVMPSWLAGLGSSQVWSP